MRLITYILVFCLSSAIAQQKIDISTHQYAQKDTASLSLDIYKLASNNALPKACLIYIHGGHFKNGSRKGKTIEHFCGKMVDSNLVVISIDYRLALKHEKNPGPFRVKPLKNAIEIASEDLQSATNWIIGNSAQMQIDTNKVFIMGSSAGAITVLHTDWYKSNKQAHILSSNFKYAGVVACAGAILTFTGKPIYADPPAPTIFFHGTKDRVVFYNKLRIFNRGFYGSATLAKIFEKNEHPYILYSYHKAGHQIAMKPMRKNISEIKSFIRQQITGNGIEAKQIVF